MSENKPPQPPTPTEALAEWLRALSMRRFSAGTDERRLGLAAASALIASSAREQEMAELMSQKLAACDVAALSNTPQTYGPPLHQDNPFWSPAYESVRAAVLREMQHRDRAEQAEAHAAALREALTALLAQSGDPNAATGEFDTAAGRARRLLNAHAPSDPAASVDAGERTTELDDLVAEYKHIADNEGEHRIKDLIWLVNELIYEREHPVASLSPAAPPKAETPTATVSVANLRSLIAQWQGQWEEARSKWEFAAKMNNENEAGMWLWRWKTLGACLTELNNLTGASK